MLIRDSGLLFLGHPVFFYNDCAICNGNHAYKFYYILQRNTQLIKHHRTEHNDCNGKHYSKQIANNVFTFNN